MCIITNDLLSDYLGKAPKDLKDTFYALQDVEISTDSFSFYTSVSSVYNRKIEGEAIKIVKLKDNKLKIG